MAAGHRTTNRAKAKARRAKDRRRNHQNHVPASAWLGAGALTLGIGAAVASGSAVAYAAPSTGDSGSATSSGAATTGASTSTTTSAAASTEVSAATATTTPAVKHSATPAVKHSATPAVKHFAAAVSSASPATTTTGFTGQTGAAGAIGSSPHAGTAAAKTPVHTTVLTASVLKTAAAPRSTARTTASATPAVSTASVTTAVTPAAVKVNPFEPILNFAMALFGVNPNVAPSPTNPIQAFLYALFTRLQDSVDPAPPAGTPIVGTADPNSGTVTGTAVFATDPSGDVTFTAPATTISGGALSINATTGAFTYTPTTGQRLTATSTTTDTFTVTAHDGLSTSTETVTVPVDAGTPVAGIPTVGTPAPGTGVVVGNAAFTDPAGRTLTYSADTTSTGGGAVTIDPTTGAFTFTPTATQLYQSNLNTDIFTATASNGVHTSTETITVPINNSSNSNYLTHAFTVYNLTSQPLEYVGIILNKDGNSIQDQPTVGSILQPGQSQNFSLVLYTLAVSKAEPNYISLGGKGGGQAIFEIDAIGHDSITTTNGTTNLCNCSVTGNSVYFLDPAGTTITLPASDPTGQAQVLQNLCGNGNVSCSFNPTSQTMTLGPAHSVGNAVTNNSNTTVTTTISITDTQSQSDSLGIGAKASGSILGIVNTEISATYGHTWTNTTAFMQSVTVTVEPHTTAKIVAQQPIYQVTGDFTLVMGNTTYIVQGVTFDTPNPNGQGTYTVTDTPITTAAEQTPPQENLSGTVTVGA